MINIEVKIKIDVSKDEIVSLVECIVSGTRLAILTTRKQLILQDDNNNITHHAGSYSYNINNPTDKNHEIYTLVARARTSWTPRPTFPLRFR